MSNCPWLPAGSAFTLDLVADIEIRAEGAITNDQTVSQRLADHVVDLRFDNIPDVVIAQTKEVLVYHLGLALRTRTTQAGARFVRAAHELSGPAGPHAIIGERRRADLLEAVFAVGGLMAELGMDDGILPSGVHPGVVVQPAAWVVGEGTHASGRELLAAVVAGYDVIGKVGQPVWTWGWDRPRGPNNVFGPLGGAAAAARLFGLSREETDQALGHAAHAGMGLIEGSTFQQPYQALLARNGVMAVVLARAGWGMASSVIEGRFGLFRSFVDHGSDGTCAYFAALMDSLSELGQSFEIVKARTKRYEASGLNIVPIELLLELTRSHGLTPDNVAGVDVVLPVEREEREAVRESDLADPKHNRIARKGSLRFQLAVIVTDGNRNPSRFDEPAGAALQEQIDRIRLRFEQGRPQSYARVELTTTDGTRVVAERDDHALPPLDWRNWLAEGGAELLSDHQLARVVDLIGNLEDVADVTEVIDCLVPVDGVPLVRHAAGAQ